MQRFVGFTRSTIGKKVVMAVTGFFLVLFVVAHMLGNLKLYQGEVDGHYKIDVYGEFLREFGYPVFGHEQFLWIARLGLLLFVALHIVSAYQVSRLSQRARPVGYRKKQSVASTYASRTMRWGGVILAAFIVYHILHLTTGTTHPEFEHGEVYRNMVVGFSSWPAAAFYIIAMIFLGLHLYHGIWSAFQTLGVSEPAKGDWRRGLAAVIALVVTVGNISMPVAVLTGVVHL